MFDGLKKAYKRYGTALATGGLSEAKRLADEGSGYLKGMYDDAGDAASSAGLDFGAAEANAQQQAANEREAERARDFIREQSAKGNTYIDQGAARGEQALDVGYDKANIALQSSLGDQLAAYESANSQGRSDLQSTPNRLADLYSGGLASGFQADPGYQFRLQQGQDAIMRSAAARGGRMGGDTLKALMEHGQNFASNEFGNYANRQIGMAQGADQSDFARNSQLASLSSMYGSQAGGAIGQTGQTRAGYSAQEGSQLADLYAQAGTNKANLGMGAAGQNTSLSQGMIANQNAGGATAANGQALMNALQLGAMAYTMSDARLKDHIHEDAGSPFERIGLRGYRWRWNKTAELLGLSGTSEGVIAQDVLEKYPHAVTVRDGWLAVDYAELRRMIGEVAHV